MTRGRISFLIFLLILGLPVAALNFGNLPVMDWINRQVEQRVPAAPSTATQEEIAPEDPFQWLIDRPEIRDVFIPNEITPARHVAVEKILSSEELLNVGEQAPDEAFLELYAAARAPALLIPYCAEVIATIGLSCDVIQTQARQNREGKWVMGGRLAFVPDAELGDPSQVENGQLFSTIALLPYTGSLRPPNTADTRAAMLQQARAVCDALRNEIGNCVLTRVIFDVSELWITDLEALPPGTNPKRVEARAEFTVYADPLQVDNNSLADLVAAFVNPT